MGSDNFSKVAVIGASSMVGSRFCELFSSPQNLVKADLKGSINIDITDKDSVKTFFKTQKFQVAILFSAFTDVDSAEKQRDDKSGICWKINVEGLSNIVDACKHYEKKLIFISTSFVFDGENGPYSETDQRGGNLDKISWYGITKIKGEEIAEQLSENHLILRIAYPYRSNFPQKEDFARQIITRYDQGTLYPMFTDQIFSPTFIDDVPIAVETLIKSNSFGIFHLGSPAPVTPYDFSYELIKVYGRDPSQLKKGSLVEFLNQKYKTPRPVNSAMLCEKIKKLGYTPTDWESGIKLMRSQTQN